MNFSAADVEPYPAVVRLSLLGTWNVKWLRQFSPLLELPHSVFAWAGFAVFAGFFFLQWCMQIDVRCEADLDRYDQLFDNPVLDTLFKADNGSGLFLQFCDRATVICVQTACFCTLLEVRDFYEEQEAREHPDRVPDPPVAWVTAEAAGGVDQT